MQDPPPLVVLTRLRTKPLRCAQPARSVGRRSSESFQRVKSLESSLVPRFAPTYGELLKRVEQLSACTSYAVPVQHVFLVKQSVFEDVHGVVCFRRGFLDAETLQPAPAICGEGADTGHDDDTDNAHQVNCVHVMAMG